MNIQVIDGKRPGSFLYHRGDGYYYHFNKGNGRGGAESNVFYLRCLNFDTRGCSGTARIEHNLGAVEWINAQPHTCAQDYTHHEVLNLRRQILNECVPVPGRSYETPAEVVRRVRARFPDAIAAEVNSDRMRSAIRRIPPSLHDLGELLTDPNFTFITTCEDGVDNLSAGTVHGPNGTCSIIFSSRRMRRYMRRCKIVFVDGTFGSRPNSPASAQVLQIVGVVGNAAVPLGQILTTSKTQEEYIAVLERLHQLVPQFRPNLVVTDFEIGLQNAWRHVFQVHVVGCYWHYCRAVSLKARHLLGGLLRNNRLMRSIVRSFLALPLLPQYSIEAGFRSLLNEAVIAGVYVQLRPFFEYFIDTWMAPAFFRSLSCYGVRHRTNNVAESCNKLLRTLTGVHRPGLWHFLTALKRYDQDTRLNLIRMNRGLRLNRKRKVSAVNNDIRIQNLTLNLMRRHISLNRFLHLASTRVIQVFDRFVE